MVILAGATLTSATTAKVEKYDCGAFVVAMNVNPEDWRVESQPQLNFVHFQKTGGVGFEGGAAFEGYVYVDRIQGEYPANLPDWFANYLKRTTGFLHSKIFDQPRNFRFAKGNPVLIDGKKLLRFDMVPKPLSRPASRTAVDEEGVVYFLLPPDFDQRKTFFVFTGRQVLSRDLGQKSELGEVENMIKGFSSDVLP